MIDIENLPPKLQFCVLAMFRSAINFKDMKMDKEFFVSFANEIWESMELTGVEYVREVIDGKMRIDIEPYVEDYINQRKK